MCLKGFLFQVWQGIPTAAFVVLPVCLSTIVRLLTTNSSLERNAFSPVEYNIRPRERAVFIWREICGEQKVTKTLIDVLLSNKPELFKYSGNYYPSVSDHALIYGVLKDRVKSNMPKVITFRSFKTVEPDVLKQHLSYIHTYIHISFI